MAIQKGQIWGGEKGDCRAIDRERWGLEDKGKVGKIKWKWREGPMEEQWKAEMARIEKSQ